MRQLRVFCLANLLAALVFAVAATGAVAAAQGKDPRQAQNAITFRHAMGLRYDSSYVIGMEDDPTQVHAYGVAMTSSERADLDQRVVIQGQLGPLAEAVRSDPLAGGVYIDEASGGTVVVATSGNVSDLRERVAGLIPKGAVVRFLPVTYSMQSLLDLQARIDADWDIWAKQGIQIVGDGPDVASNRVLIGVTNLTAVAQEAIAAKYGPAVEVNQQKAVTPMSCTSRADCIPLVGGDDIASTGYGTCTAGFLAKASSAVVLVSAGHCLNNSGMAWYQTVSYTGSQTPNWIGYQQKSTVIGSGSGTINADAGYMSVYYSSMLGNDNAIYEVNPGQYEREFAVATSTSEFPVGTLVCKSGRASFYTCGPIAAIEQTRSSGNYSVRHLTQVNFTTDFGDSGSPVFYGSGEVVLMGILSSMAAGYGYYSPVNWVDSALGVTPCLSSTCN